MSLLYLGVGSVRLLRDIFLGRLFLKKMPSISAGLRVGKHLTMQLQNICLL